MEKRLGYFGGHIHVRMILENGHRENTWFDRELWFDHDIDGRWLVGVSGPDETVEEDMGAIVVKDPTISAFIETLGKLVADPAAFAGEPMVIDSTWSGQLVDR